jgi:hypothetical protein
MEFLPGEFIVTAPQLGQQQLLAHSQRLGRRGISGGRR